MNVLNQQGGFVKFIILIIIAIIVFSYFGFDIKGVVESPRTQENLSYVWSFVLSIWTNYLSEPILYFWNSIFIDILWESFVSNMERLKEGQPTDLELLTPDVNLTPEVVE